VSLAEIYYVSIQQLLADNMWEGWSGRAEMGPCCFGKGTISASFWTPLQMGVVALHWDKNTLPGW